ncbi:MAG: hypothetical protein LUG12_07890 [Erysipelotrichaceae bacterium]|nr:hypothetical protein [Erysipelotrichaceae bacterium]
MKSKLLPPNNYIAVLLERFNNSVRIYYGDGHREVSDEKVEDYILKSSKKYSGYKNPVFVYGQKLYPIKDQRDADCIWINLDYLDAEDEKYFKILKERDILDKAIKMFLKEKEIQLKMLS